MRIRKIVLPEMLKKVLSLGVIIVVIGTGMTIFLNEKKSPKDTQRDELKVLFRENEHVFGDPAALVKIVEYAEGECIYCKRLHPVLMRVVEESGGRVALVWRHFPLTIHPKSFTEAVALECAAEVGGNASFWKYLETLYEATPSDNKIDLAILPELAQTIGIERETFSECLDSGRYQTRVRDDIESGFALSVSSVPQLFVVAPNSKVFVFRNSPSYAVLNATILAALELIN